MTETNLPLEEWKQRYASYQQYRAQYLTVLSVTATAWLVALGFATSTNTQRVGRFVILSLMLAVAILSLVAHHIARRAVRQLGERISELERAIGFEPFHTAEPLEAALKWTQLGTSFFIAVTVLLFFLV